MLKRVRLTAFALFTLMLSATVAAHAATLKVGGKGGSKTIADALSRARAGDVVLIRPGVYPGGFEVTTGVVIKGEPGARIILDPKQTISVKGADRAELTGLVVSVSGKAAGKDSAPLVRITGSRNVKISNCRLTAAGAWGIFVRGSSNTVIEHCHIGGTGQSGVWIESDQVLLHKATVTGFRYGAVIKSGKEIAVVGNLIDANETGVLVRDGQVDIVDNTINGPGSLGIEVKGGDVVVAGNAVRRYQNGVYVRAASRGEISGNTLGQNIKNALVVLGPNYRISRNIISYNDGNGILVHSAGEWLDESRALIVNNLVSGNAGTGIEINGGARVNVLENILENNRVGASVWKGDISLTHNTIVLNTGYALLLGDAANAKLRRNIFANNQQGIYASATADFDSEENVVYGHVLRSGYQLYDVGYVIQGWMPTLGGDEFQVTVMPSKELRAPSDLDIDPGFVKLGADYRLRPDSGILKRYTKGPLPGAINRAGLAGGSNP